MIQKLTAYRFKSPGFIPWAFLACSLALLLTLGTWQMQRLAWKEKLIADIQAAQAAPTLKALPKDPEELKKLAYRNVLLTGQFFEPLTLFRPTALEGRGPAYHILQPFLPTRGDYVVFADRVVVPADDDYYKELVHPTTGSDDNVYVVNAIIRPPLEARQFTPSNQPEKRLWFSEDLSAISKQLHKDLAPMVLQVMSVQYSGEEIADNPKLRQKLLTMRNDHLGYAITWFSLALIAVVMFGIYFSERKDSDA